MTEAQARKILGVSVIASRTTIEQAYHRQLRVHRLRQMPGNTCQDRQKALQELAKITEAWKTLSKTNHKPSPLPTPPKIKPKKTQPSSTTPRKTNSQPSGPLPTKPKNLQEAWEILVQFSPFTERTTAIIALVVAAIVFIAMVTH